MKKISLFALICMGLIACSEERTLKNKGLHLAEQKFAEDIKAEAQGALSNSEVLQQAYVDFMHGQSQVDVSEVKITSSTAVVSTSLTTYPVQLRKTLLSVAATVGRDKTRRFNFADAVPLVASQAGLKPQKETRPFLVLKFQKQSGTWNFIE